MASGEAGLVNRRPLLCKKSLSRAVARASVAALARCVAGGRWDRSRRGSAVRRGSLSGLNASQITAARGSVPGQTPNTRWPERRSIRTIRMPCGARNGSTGMPSNAVARELAEDRRGERAALGVAAHRPRLVEAHIDAGDDLRPSRRRTRRWSGRSWCRSCRTGAGRGRAGWSRCRAGRRLRACGRSDRRSSDRPPGGCASGGRGIGRPSQSGALQPSQGRVSARQMTRPSRSWT